MRLDAVQSKLHGLVTSLFSSLAHYAIRHPWRVLAGAALVTTAAGLGVQDLQLRTDGHALVPEQAPEVIYDRMIRQRFGLEDQIVVLIRSSHADGVFNPGTVQLVRELTAELVGLPDLGLNHIVSLATEPGFRYRPGTYQIQPLLEPALTNKAELDQLRDDLRKLELYTGTLVSFDGKSTVILVGVPSDADRTRLCQRVMDVAAAKQDGRGKIDVTGAPVAESLLGIHILEDLGLPRALLPASTRSGQAAVEGGLPRSLYELRRLVARRLGLLPVAIAVMMLVFYLSFRNLLATLLPMPEVAATLLFVFGLMGWFGVPVYLTIAVTPVLLTTMCVTDEIHLFSRYFALLRERPGAAHTGLVRETVDEMVCPVVSTTLTTAVGFISFAFSPLKPVQAFGLFTGLGVLFSLFFSLTAIPALLTLIKPAWLVPDRERTPGRPGWLSGWFAQLGPGVLRHRYWVMGFLIALLVVTPAGLWRVVVQDSWIDGFEPESDFSRATRIVNEQYHGMHLLLVCADATRMATGTVTASAVDTGAVMLPENVVADLALIEQTPMTFLISNGPPGAGGVPRPMVWHSYAEKDFRHGNRVFARVFPPGPGDFWEELRKAGAASFAVAVRSQTLPEVVRDLAGLGTFIRGQRDCAVGGVLGPADYLLTTRFILRVTDPAARRLPENVTEAKTLWDYYAAVLGERRLRQVVDTNYWCSITTVFMKDANFVGTAKLMDAISNYQREHLASQGIRIGFAGDVAVSQSLIKGIVATQVQSLLWSLVGIYAVTALLGRSWRWGVYCVLPTTLAVIISFAVMGWFGIPLGVATSMFAGMTLGIGVDFAIHLLEGYEQASAEGALASRALSLSLARTGPAVWINTLAVSLGFGILILSQVPANARLGLLLLIGLCGCMVATLLILPLLLHWWPLKRREGSVTPGGAPISGAAGS